MTAVRSYPACSWPSRGGRATGLDHRHRGAARVVSNRGDVRERLLQATYDCVGRWGLAKTTVEDAAREAGVSRATLYRYFPGGREELIAAVVSWEFARFFLRLYDEVHDCETLEEVMERGLLFAHRALVRARGAPAHLGDRARDPLAAPHRRSQRNPQARGRFLESLSAPPRHGRRRRPRRRGGLSGPHGAVVLSRRRGAGTWVTRPRWPGWCTGKCWPASGEHPNMCVPPGPRGPGALRALRPPDLHRVHDPGSRWLAVSNVRRRGEPSAPGSSDPSPTPPTPAGGEVDQSDTGGHRHCGGQRDLFHRERLRQTQRVGPLRAPAKTMFISPISTTGSSPRCSSMSASCTSGSTW